MTSPAETIARIEGQAMRVETVCGEGHMVWRRFGQGTPVILLHGGSGSWRHWIRAVEPLVAAGRQVWAPDLPGFAESDLPDPPVEFPSISRAVIEGIRTIMPGDGHLDIVGFSFGAHTSQYVAEALGSRVDRLVLVNGHVMGVLQAQPHQILERWRDITSAEERRAIFKRNLASLMFANPDNIDDLAVHIYEGDLPRSRVRPPKFINKRDLSTLSRLGCRIVNIAGEHDPLGTPSVPEQQAWLKRERPDAEIHMVRGAGHWVMYEAAETFNGILLGVLT